MKVEGQELSDVLKSLPLPQKITVVIGTLFIIFTIIYVSYNTFIAPNAKRPPAAITLEQRKDNQGIFDPAVTADNGITVLAFTSTAPAVNDAADFGTEILLSQASKSCESFDNAAVIFETKADELMGPDGVTPVTTGIWRTETPTIIHDPADTGREWKIYAYKYFWAKNIPLARMYGFIVLKTASSINGPWSEEEWVMASNKNNPPYPYAQAIKTQLDTLDPALQNVAFYARPSVLQVNNVLLMTLSAFVQGSITPDRIVMLASVDHGRSWKYLGSPLSAAMASKIGPYKTLSGATLIEDKSAVYLAAVFGDDASDGLGTVLFPFDDILKAQLRTDKKTSAPVPFKTIPRLSLTPSAMGGGFAGYSLNCHAGILTSEFSGVTGRYEIFKTYQTPTSKQ